MTVAGPATDERLPIYTSNTFDIPGLELEQHLGLCWGLIVVSLGFGRSLAGGFRSLAAGEVPEFTQAIDEARRGALFRMIEHAKRLGANAVVGVRFDSNTLGDSGGLAELVAYGSAVVVKTG
ncbi:MAG TPA: YbjQ family protein [Acidimicrobiia bacterium]|nr:YbjQ family protein [Acidimicrobiia bacterium]